MYEILKQILSKMRGMWRYRWYALIAAWAICVLGWIAVYQLPDEYESRARIFIDTQTVIKPLLKGLAVENDGQDRILLMTRALTARPNLEEVMRDTDLSLRAHDKKEYESVLAQLQKNISVQSLAREQNFYTIGYIDRDPLMAKRVVQALLDSLVEQTLGTNRTDTANAQQFLQAQIKDYEQRLIAAEQRLAEFKKQHVGLMPSEAGGYYNRLQSSLNDLQQLQTRIAVASNRRGELMKQLRGESETIGTSELELKIQERKTELNALLLKFTEQHPDVIALKDVIAQLEARKENQQSGGGNSVEQNPVYQSIRIAISEVDVELASLRTQETELKRQVEAMRKQVDTMPEVEADLARLNRDYMVTKTQYEDLVKRLESARLSEDIEKSGDNIKFRLIDPPVVPLQPSRPNRLLLIAAVLLAGLGGGVGLVYLLNELYPVYCTAEELSENVELPVLGVVTMKWSIQDKQGMKKDLLYLLAGFAVLTILFVGVVGLELSGVLKAQSQIVAERVTI